MAASVEDSSHKFQPLATYSDFVVGPAGHKNDNYACAMSRGNTNVDGLFVGREILPSWEDRTEVKYRVLQGSERHRALKYAPRLL